MKTIRTLNFSRCLAVATLLFTCAAAAAQELAIARNATNITLTWSTNYPDYILESTGSLSGTWTDVTDHTNGTVTLPVVSSNQFFRLKETVTVTHVCNEGFLISGRGRKVLVDGIFADAVWPYFEPSPSNALIVPNLVTNALPPFDNIDALLVTHSDPDHLHARYVHPNMTNDTNSILIGTAQVFSAMRSSLGSRFPAISNRCVIVATNGSTTVTVGDLEIKAAGMPHISSPETQNLGYLFTVGGLRFFHNGDCASTNILDYQALNLAAENIDVAMVNVYIFDEPARAQEILAYYNPRTIFVMHQGLAQVDQYRSVINSMTNLPPVYLMDTTMKTFRFPAR